MKRILSAISLTLCLFMLAAAGCSKEASVIAVTTASAVPTTASATSAAATSAPAPSSSHKPVQISTTATTHPSSFVTEGGVEIRSLGNPYQVGYGSDSLACLPWDVIVHNGIVHRGAGDYDKNTGEFMFYSYHIAVDGWISAGFAKDEEVSRFIDIDGTIMAPGADATGGWDLGNYYILNNSQWKMQRTIPGGVHVWDIVKHDGKLFFGLGVDSLENATPIVYTEDGESFTFVPLYKDGQLRSDTSGMTILRAYEFYELNGELFAFVVRGPYSEFYRFEGDRFEYICQSDKFSKGCAQSYRMFAGECEFEGAVYLLQNFLFRSENGTDFKKLPMPNNEFVCDMFLEEGVMKLLAYDYDTETKLYTTIIYSMQGGEIWEELRFDYRVPPLSFDKDGDTWYIGMRSTSGEDLINGTLLQVKP